MLKIMKRNTIGRVATFVILLTVAVCSTPINTQGSHAATHSLNNPRITTNGDVTWDCVEFGLYPQNSSFFDDHKQKEPIKWRVLCVNGNEALLLSEKNLRTGRHYTYKDFTWEVSLVRSSLTGFLDMAFSPDEQNSIYQKTIYNTDNPEYKTKGGNPTIDKIFCLSIDEISNPAYGFPSDCSIASETRKTVGTNYATGVVAAKKDIYWLRSPGITSKSAAIVNADGVVDIRGSKGDDISIGIRPALWLDLSSDVWSYAGTASAKMGTAPKKTKAATVTKPAKVTIKKVTSPKKKTLKVTWKRDSKATGYQAMIATDKKFKKNKKTATISKNKTVSKTFTKLKSKKVYYAKVRAYKKSGSKKVYGAYSKVKKVKVK